MEEKKGSNLEGMDDGVDESTNQAVVPGEENQDGDLGQETDVETVDGQDSESAEVEDEGLSPDQIAELQRKAKQYDEILPEFTRRSQKLSEYQKTLEAQQQSKPPIITDEDLDIDPDTEKLLDTWARKKGYAPLDDIKRTQYESEKEVQIKSFIEKHPEYNVENDPHNIKWNRLVEEINAFYRMPQNPKEISTLLKKVHSSLNVATEVNKAESRALAKAKKAKDLSIGGTGKGSVKSKKAGQLSQSQIEAYKAGGWTDEEINELIS